MKKIGSFQLLVLVRVQRTLLADRASQSRKQGAHMCHLWSLS
jgi:hypothetical protein